MRKVKFTTNLGDIVLELDDDKAPISTENMIAYIKAGHYDDLLFHRVIDGFMIQGGGYDHELKKRPPRNPIENEATNGLKNLKGSVAMARTPEIGSGTSQFFINVVDNPFLDHKDETPEGYGYAVFGKVVEGMDTVDKIRQVKTGAKGPFSKDCPLEDVTIEEASILDADDDKADDDKADDDKTDDDKTDDDKADDDKADDDKTDDDKTDDDKTDDDKTDDDKADDDKADDDKAEDDKAEDDKAEDDKKADDDKTDDDKKADDDK